MKDALQLCAKNAWAPQWPRACLLIGESLPAEVGCCVGLALVVKMHCNFPAQGTSPGGAL